MQESLYSPQWYRIAQIKPRLRSHITISRHNYRGKLWFIYRDESTGRTHRFSELTHRLLALMNGTRTMTEIWSALTKHLRNQAPSQDSFIQLLHYLRSNGLLATDVGSGTEDIVSRSRAHRAADWKRRFSNPLALRIKLINPDRFLESTIAYVNWIFRPWCILIWLITIAIATLLAATNWQAIHHDTSINAFTTHNLFALALIYPAIKLIHELAHAYAIKKWGGEVNELGIMLLLFMPVPYVNASAATSFSNTTRRIVVSAAGIMLELILASFALFLWMASEDGLVKQISLNVMLIGGISTLLFNGNPLLRYDAYYVLSDVLGIPNLGARSNQYIGYLLQRYFFGISNAASPAHDRNERFWLFSYSIASFCYRVFLLSAIVIFLWDGFFIIGVALAVWAVFSQLILPAGKVIKRTIASPLVRKHGARAIIATGSLFIFTYILIFFTPIPHRTVVEGVIVPNDDSQIRAEIDGEVRTLFVRGPSEVIAGQAIVELSNPALDAQISDLAAQLDALKIQYAAEWATDPAAAEQLQEQIYATETQLNHAKDDQSRLIIRSSKSGLIIVPNENDLLGRYITQGTTVAYLKSSTFSEIKAAVNQDVAPFIQAVDEVMVKFNGTPTDPLSARITTISPGATDILPSPALSTEGGGIIPVQTTKDGTRATLGKYVVIDLSLTGEIPPTLIGQRVYVRFSHGSETLSKRITRSVRQLFLGKFDA